MRFLLSGCAMSGCQAQLADFVGVGGTDTVWWWDSTPAILRRHLLEKGPHKLQNFSRFSHGYVGKSIFIQQHQQSETELDCKLWSTLAGSVTSNFPLPSGTGRPCCPGRLAGTTIPPPVFSGGNRLCGLVFFSCFKASAHLQCLNTK